MNNIDSRIEAMRIQSARLVSLLQDPHPGLFTWVRALDRVATNIKDIMDGTYDPKTDTLQLPKTPQEGSGV